MVGRNERGWQSRDYYDAMEDQRISEIEFDIRNGVVRTPTEPSAIEDIIYNEIEPIEERADQKGDSYMRKAVSAAVDAAKKPGKLLGYGLLLASVALGSMGYVRNADAGKDCIDQVTISQYWNSARPANDPSLPDGTRVRNYGDGGICPGADVVADNYKNDDTGGWRPGDDFSGEYFTSQNAKKMQEVFSQHGVDLNKFNRLVKKINSNSIGVGLFDDGKIIIYDNDKNQSYLIPTKPGIWDATMSIYQ